MKIRVSLNPDSIDAAIRQLEEYQKGLETKAKLLCERLAAAGYQVASFGFGSAQYDGTNDVSVELLNDGEKLVIKASGEVVMFVEFGAGVHYADDYPSEVKSRVPDIVGRGQYGKGHGKQETWAYYGDDAGTNGWKNPKRPGLVFTHGNPANMPMYNASKDMRSQMEQIAREVFKT